MTSFTGTGDLTLENNANTDSAIVVTSAGPTGRIITSGSGTGSIKLRPSSLPATVTGIVQGSRGRLLLNFGINAMSGDVQAKSGSIENIVSGGFGSGSLVIGDTGSADSATIFVTHTVDLARPIIVASGPGKRILAYTGPEASVAFTGGSTGAGNLVLKNDGSTSGAAVSFDMPMHAGILTSLGTSSGATTVTNPGAGLRLALDAGSAGSLILSSPAVTDSLILENRHATTPLEVTGISGSGNLVLERNGAADLTAAISGFTGSVMNRGTASGDVTFNAGSGVALATQASATSRFILSSLTVGVGGTTVRNTAGGSLALISATGTGDITLDNASSVDSSLLVSSSSINGNLINAGSGSGSSFITGGVGSNTRLVQNSLTSRLFLTNGSNNSAQSLSIRKGYAVVAQAEAVSAAGVTVGVTDSLQDAGLYLRGVTFDRPVTLTSGNGNTRRMIGNFGNGNASFTGALTVNANLSVRNEGTGVFTLPNEMVLNGYQVFFDAPGNIAGAIQVARMRDAGAFSQNTPTPVTLGLQSRPFGTQVVNNSGGSFTLAGVEVATGSRLWLANNSLTAGGITMRGDNSLVTGTVWNLSEWSGSVRIVGSLGGGAKLVQKSATSPLILDSLTLTAPGLTLLDSVGRVTVGGVSGAGALTLGNYTATDSAILVTGPVNHAGALIHEGSGAGSTKISATIGANVTSVTQNSATSVLSLGDLTIVPGGTTLRNNGGALLSLDSTHGTGDLILHNASSVDSAIRIVSGNFKHAGSIRNAGSGSGLVKVAPIALSGVTELVQESNTSALWIGGGLTHTVPVRIVRGAAAAQTVTAFGSGGGRIYLGDSVGIDSASVFTHLGNANVATPVTLVSGSTGKRILGANFPATDTVIWSGGFDGETDLTIRTPTENTIAFSGLMNIYGTVFRDGAGSGRVLLNGGVGDGVRELVQNSASGALSVPGGLFVNGFGTILTNNGGATLRLSGTVRGTGDLNLNNASARDSAITLDAADFTHVGRIRNVGTSTGASLVVPTTMTGVTEITQESGTSTLHMGGNLTHATPVRILRGSAVALSVNAFGGATGRVYLGDSDGTDSASVFASVSDSIETPITLVSGSTGKRIVGGVVINAAFKGGITGVADLTLKNSTIADFTLSGEPLNITGTVSSAGSSSGTIVLRSGVGSNVRQLNQVSATARLWISGALVVRDSGTTVSKNADGVIAFRGGTIGTGGLILANNATSGDFEFSNGRVNHSGYVHNIGTGTKSVAMYLDTNVTEVVQKSATSQVFLSTSRLGSKGKTIIADSTGIIIVSGSAGTGNLQIENRTSLDYAIAVPGLGHNGLVINAGSGTGAVSFGALNNVDLLIQNSLSSMIQLNGGLSSGFGGVRIRRGVARVSSTSAFGSAGTVRLGDSTGSDSAKLIIAGSGNFSRPMVLDSGTSGNLVLEAQSASNTGWNGGITGKNNLIVRNQGSLTLSFATGPLNITGRLTNAGTGSGSVVVSSSLGANMSFLQNSSTSPVTLSSTNPSFQGTLEVTRGIVNANASTSFGQTGNMVLGDSVGTDSAAVYGLVTTTTNRPVIVVSGSGKRILGSKGTAALATFKGGVTGTGDITVNNQGASGQTVFDSLPVNNIGKITVVGTSTAANSSTQIKSGVGPNVREVILDGSAGTLSIQTTAINVRDSGTTLRNNTSESFSLSSGTTGTGGFIVAAGGVDFSGSTFNHTGSITKASNSNAVLPNVGANVTRIEHSGRGILGIATMAVGAWGKVLRNTSDSAGSEFNVNASTGAGDVTIENNGLGQDVRLSGSINHAGRLINAGTGPGVGLVAGLGANVTDVVQNSIGSGLRTAGTNEPSGSIKILKGTLTAISGTSLGSGSVILGDSVGADSARLAFQLPALGTIAIASPLVVATGTTGKLFVDALSDNFSTLNLTGGVTGNNDITLRNYSSETVTFTSANAVNNSGTVFFADGVARAFPVQSFGSNVRKVHKLWGGRLDLGSIVVNDSGTTVVNGGGFPLAFNGTSGTGALTVQTNGSAGLEVSGSVNHAGTFTNSGTHGFVTVAGVLGPNITGVIQNSPNSSLHLSVDNTYSSPTTIQSGTLMINSSAGLGDASATNKLVFAGGTFLVQSDISSPSTRPMVLQDTAYINVTGSGFSGSRTLTFAGPISGPGSLVKSGGGKLILGGTGNATVGGNIRIDQDSLILTGPLQLKGEWINNGGFRQTAGGLVFAGATAQKIRGNNTTNFKSISISNDSGVRIETSPLITDSLVFVRGKLFADSNKVTLGASAATRGGAMGQFVVGNLEKQFSGSSPEFTFPVGEGASYRPVTVGLQGSSVSGSLTASTNLADTTGLGSSGFNAGNDVSGSWSIEPTGLSGFSTYSVTPTWSSTDLDVGATPLSYTVRKLDGGVWSNPVTDNRTPTSARATGLTSFSTFRVGQIAPPGAPTLVVASRSDSSLIVSWSAPDSGGARIARYTAVTTPGAFTCVADTGSPVTTSCKIPGLTNGTAYTVQVTAANEGGNGPVSSASASAIPSSVATKPLALTAIPKDSTALLSWSAPTANGGAALTAYTVTAIPGGLTCTVNASDTTCTVSGLTNGTAYRFTVAAFNAAGQGPSSDTTSAVTPLQAPAALSYAITSFGRNVPVNSSSPTVSGGSSALVYTLEAGTLPPGLSLDTATGILSGKPTTAGEYTPTLRVRNVGGFKDTTLVFTVNGFQYAIASTTYGKHHGVTPNTVSGVTGVGGSYSASPALPLGIVLDASTGSVSGEARVAAAMRKYAITRNFPSGSATDTIQFAVNGFSYSADSATYTQYSATPGNTVDSIVGTGGVYTITPGLPAGFSLDSVTGAISGTPVASLPRTKYAITRNFADASASDTISFSVNTAAPSLLTYGSESATYGKNTSIDTNSATVGTATDGLVFSISAGTLPSGLKLDTATGKVTGIPKQNGSFTPTIRVSNNAGFAEKTLSLTVNGFSYGGHYYLAYGKNFAITPKLMASVTGTGGFYTIVPALPAGLVLDSVTGTLSGTPTQQANGVWHTITRNFAGATATDSIVVDVAGFTSNAASVLRQHAPVPTNILTPVVGSFSEYSITPDLPEGVYLSLNNGRLFGTPTKTQLPKRYVLLGTSFGSPSARDTLTLSVVLASPSALAYTLDTAVYGRNVAIAANAPIVGTATDSLKYRLVSGALPGGLLLDSITGALSGKPAQFGVFTPTIRVANDSGFVDKTLQVTVNGFSYASATNTYGKNHGITANSITSFTGTGGTYSVSPAFPTGLSLNPTTGAVTGIPTAQQASSVYVVSRDFNGASATDTVAIAVIGFTLSAASVNTLQHVSITPVTAGGIVGTGGTYTVTPSLPAGLALDATTGAISGSATSAQPATLYAVTRDFAGASATDSVAISVILAAPASLAYVSDTAVYSKYVSIAPNTATVGSATDGLQFTLASGAFPMGLSLNSTTGTITGTPTQVGAFNPKIRVANDSGFTEKTLNLTVNGFQYAVASAAYGKNHPIAANTVQGVTGTGGTYTINPSLPSGLTLNNATGEISGKPAIQIAATRYSVTRDFTAGAVTDTIMLKVNGFTYATSSVNALQNSSLAPDTVGLVVGSGGTYSVTPTLPAGLTLNASTGSILGTPTVVQSSLKYAVTRDFADGSATDTVSIAVGLRAPASIAYLADSAVYGKNQFITPNTVTVGAATDNLAFTISSGALPTGLLLDSATGSITGKPTEAGVFTPTIRVTNDSGSADQAMHLTVNGFRYVTPSATYGKNHPIPVNTVTGVTGVGTIYSVEPALPAGLVLNPSTGAITGIPTSQTSTAKYAVHGAFEFASAVDTVEISVNGFTYSMAAVKALQYASILMDTIVSAQGTGGAYSVTPTLPDGLALNTATGAISGTPTAVQSVVKYAVTRDFAGASATDTVSIGVGLRAPTSIAYVLDSAVYGKNHVITANTVTVGTATDGLGFTVASGALPPGISLNASTGAISGMPTATGDYTATIRVTNDSGFAEKTLRMAVNGFGYAQKTQTYGKNIAIPANTVSTSVGSGGTYSVSPALPTGLNLNASTGEITGTPLVWANAAPYVFTRDFTGASASDTVTLSVNGFRYVTRTVAYAQHAPIAALQVDSVFGTGGTYSVTPALPSGLSLDASTGLITGTPTTTQLSQKYVVTRPFTEATAVDTISISVFQAGPSALTYTTETATYGKNSTIVANLPSVGTATDNLSYTVSSGTLPVGLSLNASSGAITGTPKVSGIFTPTIRVSNDSGFSEKTLNLTVNGFAYTHLVVNATQHSSVTNPVDSVVGSGGAYSVSPVLPAGLSLNTTTGTISGTPTVVQPAQKYAIARNFTGLSASDTVSIAVTLAGPSGLVYALDSAAYGKNISIAANVPTVGTATEGLTFAITAGALPAGLTLDSSTGVIRGKPLESGLFTPTVRVTNAQGSFERTLQFVIHGFSYTASSVYGKNRAINANVATGVTGNGGTYSVIPTLPAGLTLDALTGVITGTPFVSQAATKYAITRDFIGGSAADTLSITVNGFAYATSTASYPQYSAITANTISGVIGTGGSYSVEPALPTGLSLNAATGEITGTPTVAQALTKYSVSRDYAGATGTDTVSISVITAGPSSLSYAAASPVYSRNVAIAANLPTVGTATDGLVFTLASGALPDGLSLNASTGAITGTPTVHGNFAPKIRVANGEGAFEQTLAITVNGFTYTAATATYGKNQAISVNTLSGFTGTGGNYSVSPSLPAGLSLNASTGALSGTPTLQQALTKYAVTREFTGAAATDTLSIKVTGFTYAIASANYPQNTTITANIATTVIGDSGTYTVSPDLPAGLVLNEATGEITGTPTSVQSSSKYAVTRNFPTASATDTISIAVSLAAPSSLTYALEAPVYGKNMDIPTNAATVGLATDGLAFSVVSGALPAGLSLNTTTGAITGKPSASGLFTATIRVSNGAGSQDRSVGITVNGFTYPIRDTSYAKGIPIPSHTAGGITGSGGLFNVSPALPDGLALDAATGAITGTPTSVKSAEKYAITRNFNGASASDTLTLAVFLASPADLQYVFENPVYAKGDPISSNVPILTAGDQDLTFAVQSGALPNGLVLNTATGAITGSPTAAGSYAVTVRATNASGFADRALSITVPGFVYSVRTSVFTKGAAATANDPQNVFGNGGKYSVVPSLPGGLVLDTLTGRIAGTPTDIRGLTRYAITRNFSGATVTDTISITVQHLAPATLTYATPAPAYNFGEAIFALATTVTGGTEGITYSVSSGALPTGLVLNASSGAISGTPTALGSFPVTLRTANTGGFAEASLTLTVRTALLVVRYSNDSVRHAVNQPAAALVPTATGGTILTWTISPNLATATGLSFDSTTGAISGTASIAAAPTPYVITAIGLGDARGRDTLIVTTYHLAPTVTYVDTTLNWNVDAEAAPFSKSSSTGLVTRYSIAPALPAGVLFDTTQGRLSGKPTTVSALTAYVVTVHGPGGTGSDTVRLATNAVAPKLVLSVDSVHVVTGTVVEPVSATNTGGRILRWSLSLGSNGQSLAANTGLLFDSTTGIVSGTASVPSAMLTYTLHAIGLGGTQDSVVVRVGVDPSSALRAYAFRVSGRSAQYALRMPVLQNSVKTVTVEISGVNGRKVWWRRVDVQKERLPAGTLLWDGRDQRGMAVSAGMYIVRVAVSDGLNTLITKERLAVEK